MNLLSNLKAFLLTDENFFRFYKYFITTKHRKNNSNVLIKLKDSFSNYTARIRHCRSITYRLGIELCVASYWSHFRIHEGLLEH